MQAVMEAVAYVTIERLLMAGVINMSDDDAAHNALYIRPTKKHLGSNREWYCRCADCAKWRNAKLDAIDAQLEERDAESVTAKEV